MVGAVNRKRKLDKGDQGRKHKTDLSKFSQHHRVLRARERADKRGILLAVTRPVGNMKHPHGGEHGRQKQQAVLAVKGDPGEGRSGT